jgi:CRP/FNR family transcriptional regulator, cyclic AMP receptor protein
MACDPAILKNIPLFALLDAEGLAVLAAQLELRIFAARQRIYRKEEPGGQAYVLLSGKVRVTTVDEDQQEVVVDEPSAGSFFGFAAMLEQSAHHTSALALEETRCLEVSREDIMGLLQRKPLAGMDLLTAFSRQLHAAQELVRTRSTRNPNDLIEEKASMGERVADQVARFGGSWTFIITFGVLMSVYTGINVLLGKTAWDPYPFILLNLFLSMLAAIQAPVIMMSQNRQDTNDRLRGELDFDVNRRAASDIRGLSRKLNELDEKIDDIAGLLRHEK